MDLVYILENNYSLMRLVTDTLNTNGFKTRGFLDCESMSSVLEKEKPKVFIVSSLLKKEEYRRLSELRELNAIKDIPVIMMDVKTSKIDRVRLIDTEKDKDNKEALRLMELISYINDALERNITASDKDGIINFESITMDLANRKIYVGEEEIKLTYKEYELLYYLLINEGVVLSREKLMNEIWGYDDYGSSRTVDVHIRTLRRKLKDSSSLIKTVRKEGYKISRE